MPRRAVILVLAGVGCALAVAAMRMDLIRVGYGAAQALEQEQALRAEHRQLRVQVQRLLHPGRLAERARQLGFVRPQRVIELPGDPAPSDRRLAASPPFPSVGEGP